jgi:uncharacterized protein
MGDMAALRRTIAARGRMIVAFSGGVDSALLAWVANDVLGDRKALAVTAVSPSLAPSELEDCRRFAKSWGLRWMEIETYEGQRPAFVANGLDRCYHCKSELMDRIAPVAAEEGAVVALGVNVDDLTDHRPGQAAARERGAVFPLVEAGYTKSGVRAAAKEIGLEAWDKPAAACLASRVPYGTAVTMGTLRQVASAEEALRRLGFRAIRVRHYGYLARIEIPTSDILRAVESRREVVSAVKAAGYRYVTLDLEGLRSGNLNHGLVP